MVGLFRARLWCTAGSAALIGACIVWTAAVGSAEGASSRSTIGDEPAVAPREKPDETASRGRRLLERGRSAEPGAPSPGAAALLAAGGLVAASRKR